MTPVLSEVSFKAPSFNWTEPRDYFTNPGCYGDDVANWMIAALRAKGVMVDEEPGQEDFGWYFHFTVAEREYCFVMGYRPTKDATQHGEWVGWLEHSVGILESMFGGRGKPIPGPVALTIHEVLAGSERIQDLKWYPRNGFDTCHESDIKGAPC